MKSPITGKAMKLMLEKQGLTFRREKFNVFYHYYLCEDSGEQFESAEQLELNLTQVYNQYRTKYDIPFTEEIIQIRQQYELPATKMAGALGFGTNMWRNYENGEIPSVSNGKLIRLIKNPKEFWKLVKNGQDLPDKVKSKLHTRIKELIQHAKTNRLDIKIIERLQGGISPSVYTGFRLPNFEKFSHMVLYFAQHVTPWKVKLNKLLFYADFYHYKTTGYSISGTNYQAIKMGPVPRNYDGLFNEVFRKGIVDIELHYFDDSAAGEQYKAGEITFDTQLFSTVEMDSLEKIVSLFKGTSTKEIIEISHEEIAWKEGIKNKDIIDYSYAWELKNAL